MIEIDVYGNQTHQSGEEPLFLIWTVPLGHLS